MNKLSIGIDVDGTTLDSSPAWWTWLHHMTRPHRMPKTLNEFIHSEESKGREMSYDLTKYFPLPANHNVDAFDFWRQTGVYDTIDPIRGAVTTIKRLMTDGHEITFVTHNKGNGGRSKFMNLERLFGRDSFNQMITKEKHMCRIDCLIDDRYDFLNKCQEVGIQGFHFPSPFTQDIEPHPDIISCTSWFDVYTKLGQFYGD